MMIDGTPLLRLYARRRLRQLSRMDPVETQRTELRGLVRRAQDTRFGLDHDFASIRTVEDFHRRVPLRGYEPFWNDYWKPRFPDVTDATWPGHTPYFAVSSGTSTGRTKYIPVSHEMTRSNSKAALDVIVHHLANRPHSRVFGGKNMMLGGSVDLADQDAGVKTGDLTGIAFREVPFWAKPFAFPPRGLAREADWERKIAIIGERSLSEDIRTIAGTASWLLMYFEKLLEMRPGPARLVRFYPNLELVVYGGVNFAPYRRQFETWLEGSHAELREVYPASEGFVALADRGVGEGLRLHMDGGIFFEFVPVEELDSDNPTRHWVADIEVGRDYAVHLSTCAGLWAYRLGDTVRFVDRDPPRLVVTGRTSYYLSAFGEHLTGEEIETAVTEAADAIAGSLSDFSVGAVYPRERDARGGHLFVVEFAGAAEGGGAEAFARHLDVALCRLNEDYEAHRAGGQMTGPSVLLVPHGTFAEWMRGRHKLGGQNKVPRVILDEELLATLRELAERVATDRAGPG